MDRIHLAQNRDWWGLACRGLGSMECQLTLATSGAGMQVRWEFSFRHGTQNSSQVHSLDTEGSYPSRGMNLTPPTPSSIERNAQSFTSIPPDIVVAWPALSHLRPRVLARSLCHTR
jgi:hypothetical protein